MSETRHGVFMKIFDQGVLLTGKSGIGKSEIALGLITNGHRLITDDIVQLEKTSDDKIIGSAPEALKHFLEVRGLGILNVIALYGEDAYLENFELNLIIHYAVYNSNEMAQLDRIHGEQIEQILLDIPVTEITIPVAPGRNMATLTECAVKNYQLQQKGYIASEAFLKQRKASIDNHDS